MKFEIDEKALEAMSGEELEAFYKDCEAKLKIVQGYYFKKRLDLMRKRDSEKLTERKREQINIAARHKQARKFGRMA